MANEATVFSLTTTEMATEVADRVDGGSVDVSTQNANAVPASIDIGLYYLKSKYEGINGRSKLLRQLNILKAQIYKGAWPPI